MAKIRGLDRVVVKMLGEEMEQALQGIATKYGIKIARGGGSFEALEASLKFCVTVEGKNGETKENSDFKKYAELMGLEVDDLGKSIEIKCKTFTIIGLAPRRTKRPVIVADSNGKNFVMTVGMVKNALGRNQDGEARK